MNYLIVAVGGTGQMILHYYVQLWLTGTIRHPFQAILLDTDRSLESLAAVKRLFDLARQGAGSDAKLLPSIDYVHVEPKQGNNIFEALTGTQLPPEHAGLAHSGLAFFERSAVQNPASTGLFARPALASAIACEAAIAELHNRAIPDETRAVAIGSFIGGTGGGLMVPVLETLGRMTAGRTGCSRRAVFFGQYFQPRPGVIDPGATLDATEQRFASNKTLEAKILKEAVPGLTRHAFIEDPRMPVRDYRREVEARRLAWPDPEAPFWRGVAALEFLLTDNVPAEPPSLLAGEVNIEQCLAGLPYANADAQLRRRVPRADTLARKDVVGRMRSEHEVDRVWGKPLRLWVEGYSRIAANAAGGAPREFMAGVGRHLELLWNGDRGHYGMVDLFPGDIDRSLVPVEQIRNTKWPAVPSQVDTGRFAHLESAERITAALLLIHALGA